MQNCTKLRILDGWTAECLTPLETRHGFIQRLTLRVLSGSPFPSLPSQEKAPSQGHSQCYLVLHVAGLALKLFEILTQGSL